MRPYNELKKEFLYSRDFAESTIKTYNVVLSLFAVWIVKSGNRADMLTAADLLEYKRYLLNEKKLSFNSVALYLMAIQSFFDYLYEIGERGKMHIKRLGKKKRFDCFIKEHLTDEEQKRLTDYVQGESGIIGKRDRAIITLLMCTGIRCVEASRLTIGDLKTNNPDNCAIQVQRKGTFWKDTLKITRTVAEPIKEYLRERGASGAEDRVFVTHQKGIASKPISPQEMSIIVTKIMKKAGVYSRTKTPHSLRHTAAVNAVKLGVSPWEIQAMLGHRSSDTTQIYVKSVQDELRRNNTAVKALSDAFSERQKEALKVK
jgi:site-specific recombinase XerD